jgi:uncharacterized protein YbjT (DUF2867 family)
VVNCAGLLQDSPGESTRGVHVEGVDALFEACERAGLRRVVQISAIGVDREQPTDFTRTKAEGDQALMRRDLDWVVLRPSVVVGRAAYGGSALFRALAALPVLPVMPGSGPLQIVQLDDLTRTVGFFLSPAAPSRMVLDVAGPELLSFEQVVQAYRGWLGWKPPRLLAVPTWLAGVVFRLGDFAGWLGWRPPIRSTARLEIARGAFGDTQEWRRITGFEPQRLSVALRDEPASVQERWFAKCYLLKPVGLVVFSAFWIATGLASLGPGWSSGRDLLTEAGLSPGLASFGAVAGALADIAIGTAVAMRRTNRFGLLAALAVSILYLSAGTLLLPRLWADPLGPLLKILPIILLNLMLLAIREDR